MTTASLRFGWWGAAPLYGHPLDLRLLDLLQVRPQLSECCRDISVDNDLVEQVTVLVLHVFSQANHLLKILLLWAKNGHEWDFIEKNIFKISIATRHHITKIVA